MDFAAFRSLLRGSPDRLAVECAKSLDDGRAQQVFVSPGRLSAADALKIFAIRQKTALDAGIEAIGFEDLFQNLRALDPVAQIELIGFKNPQFVYSILAQASGGLVGCIRVRLRTGLPPSLREQGLG